MGGVLACYVGWVTVQSLTQTRIGCRIWVMGDTPSPLVGGSEMLDSRWSPEYRPIVCDPRTGRMFNKVTNKSVTLGPVSHA